MGGRDRLLIRCAACPDELFAAKSSQDAKANRHFTGQFRVATLPLMLSCFGDESYDERKQRVFVVAGVIGNEAQWSWLERAWAIRTEGVPFHANHCESDRGVYAHRSHQENQELYKDLIGFVANSGVVGYAFGIDLAAQRAVFPNAPDIAYYKCFIEVMNGIHNLASKHNETVKFTFDTRLESDANANLLYGQLIEAVPEWKARFVPRIEFVSSTAHWRIQVADLVARESMKLIDTVLGNNTRPLRKSWLRLNDSDRFLVDVVSRDWFQDLERQLPEVYKRDGMEEEKYRQWLCDCNRQHNITNLFLWVHAMAMDRRKYSEDSLSSQPSQR